MNVNSLIFPKIIELWNKTPKDYYEWAGNFLPIKEQAELIGIVHEWTKQDNYDGEYLNEE